MYSDNEKVVLCGASAYEQKYYFNQDFASLPQSVQDELHVMCVMFTLSSRYQTKSSASLQSHRHA